MTPADAKILAEELIALNALTNASYVSNNGVLQQAKLAGIILDLVSQLEALQPGELTYEPEVDPIEIAEDTPKPKRRVGRPRKVKDE